jgi:hypothetical protein
MKNRSIIIVLAILAVSLIVWAETVPQTQTVLKSYFITGSVPTQNDYYEFIDTMFYYIGWTYTNAQAAAASASNAVTAAAISPRCWGLIQNYNAGASRGYSVTNWAGCSLYTSNAGGSVQWVAVVTFNNPVTNPAYFNVGNAAINASSVTTNGFQINIGTAPGGGVSSNVTFAIFGS